MQIIKQTKLFLKGNFENVQEIPSHFPAAMVKEICPNQMLGIMQGLSHISV